MGQILQFLTCYNSNMDSTELKKEIGERVKNYRLMRNTTQSKLAEIAGVSADSVSRIERGLDVSSNSLCGVLIALDLQKFLLDIPNENVRPLDRVRFHGRERIRASTYKETENKTWSWGDE